MLFREMIEGFAVNEMIYNDRGEPVDYRIIDINPAFERLTGLPRNVLGKTIREIMPEIEHYWIETYGHVARTGEPARLKLRRGARQAL